ncbi:hypothetical protein DIPPA_19224 [Diplonema papillatum]|nr:hypothetical protein DIPPA_19224 [Diplonema papillatum]
MSRAERVVARLEECANGLPATGDELYDALQEAFEAEPSGSERAVREGGVAAGCDEQAAAVAACLRARCADAPSVLEALLAPLRGHPSPVLKELLLAFLRFACEPGETGAAAADPSLAAFQRAIVDEGSLVAAALQEPHKGIVRQAAGLLRACLVDHCPAPHAARPQQGDAPYVPFATPTVPTIRQAVIRTAVRQGAFERLCNLALAPSIAAADQVMAGVCLTLAHFLSLDDCRRRFSARAGLADRVLSSLAAACGHAGLGPRNSLSGRDTEWSGDWTVRDPPGGDPHAPGKKDAGSGTSSRPVSPGVGAQGLGRGADWGEQSMAEASFFAEGPAGASGLFPQGPGGASGLFSPPAPLPRAGCGGEGQGQGGRAGATRAEGRWATHEAFSLVCLHAATPPAGSSALLPRLERALAQKPVVHALLRLHTDAAPLVPELLAAGLGKAEHPQAGPHEEIGETESHRLQRDDTPVHGEIGRRLPESEKAELHHSQQVTALGHGEAWQRLSESERTELYRGQQGTMQGQRLPEGEKAELRSSQQGTARVHGDAGLSVTPSSQTGARESRAGGSLQTANGRLLAIVARVFEALQGLFEHASRQGAKLAAELFCGDQLFEAWTQLVVEASQPACVVVAALAGVCPHLVGVAAARGGPPPCYALLGEVGTSRLAGRCVALLRDPALLASGDRAVFEATLLVLRRLAYHTKVARLIVGDHLPVQALARLLDTHSLTCAHPANRRVALLLASLAHLLYAAAPHEVQLTFEELKAWAPPKQLLDSAVLRDRRERSLVEAADLDALGRLGGSEEVRAAVTVQKTWRGWRTRRVKHSRRRSEVAAAALRLSDLEAQGREGLAQQAFAEKENLLKGLRKGVRGLAATEKHLARIRGREEAELERRHLEQKRQILRRQALDAEREADAHRVRMTRLEDEFSEDLAEAAREKADVAAAHFEPAEHAAAARSIEDRERRLRQTHAKIRLRYRDFYLKAVEARHEVVDAELERVDLDLERNRGLYLLQLGEERARGTAADLASWAPDVDSESAPIARGEHKAWLSIFLRARTEGFDGILDIATKSLRADEEASFRKLADECTERVFFIQQRAISTAEATRRLITAEDEGRARWSALAHHRSVSLNCTFSDAAFAIAVRELEEDAESFERRVLSDERAAWDLLLAEQKYRAKAIVIEGRLASVAHGALAGVARIGDEAEKAFEAMVRAFARTMAQQADMDVTGEEVEARGHLERGEEDSRVAIGRLEAADMLAFNLGKYIERTVGCEESARLDMEEDEAAERSSVRCAGDASRAAALSGTEARCRSLLRDGEGEARAGVAFQHSRDRMLLFEGILRRSVEIDEAESLAEAAVSQQDACAGLQLRLLTAQVLAQQESARRQAERSEDETFREAIALPALRSLAAASFAAASRTFLQQEADARDELAAAVHAPALRALQRQFRAALHAVQRDILRKQQGAQRAIAERHLFCLAAITSAEAVRRLGVELEVVAHVDGRERASARSVQDARAKTWRRLVDGLSEWETREREKLEVDCRVYIAVSRERHVHAAFITRQKDARERIFTGQAQGRQTVQAVFEVDDCELRVRERSEKPAKQQVSYEENLARQDLWTTGMRGLGRMIIGMVETEEKYLVIHGVIVAEMVEHSILQDRERVSAWLAMQASVARREAGERNVVQLEEGAVRTNIQTLAHVVKTQYRASVAAIVIEKTWRAWRGKLVTRIMASRYARAAAARQVSLKVSASTCRAEDGALEELQFQQERRFARGMLARVVAGWHARRSLAARKLMLCHVSCTAYAALAAAIACKRVEAGSVLSRWCAARHAVSVVTSLATRKALRARLAAQRYDRAARRIAMWHRDCLARRAAKAERQAVRGRNVLLRVNQRAGAAGALASTVRAYRERRGLGLRHHARRETAVAVLALFLRQAASRGLALSKRRHALRTVGLVQAAARAKLCRAGVVRRRQDCAARVVQCLVRCAAARARLRRRREEHRGWCSAVIRHHAAATIQRVVRGRQGRATARGKRRERARTRFDAFEQRSVSAAKRVQAVLRGAAARDTLRELRVRAVQAAEVLQRQARRLWAASRLAERRVAYAEKLHRDRIPGATLIVQAKWRTCLAKNRVRTIKRQLAAEEAARAHAARVVLRVGRGFTCRRELCATAGEAGAAALGIQCAWRRARARDEASRRRCSASARVADAQRVAAASRVQLFFRRWRDRRARSAYRVQRFFRGALPHVESAREVRRAKRRLRSLQLARVEKSEAALRSQIGWEANDGRRACARRFQEGGQLLGLRCFPTEPRGSDDEGKVEEPEPTEVPLGGEQRAEGPALDWFNRAEVLRRRGIETGAVDGFRSLWVEEASVRRKQRKAWLVVDAARRVVSFCKDEFRGREKLLASQLSERRELRVRLRKVVRHGKKSARGVDKMVASSASTQRQPSTPEHPASDFSTYPPLRANGPERQHSLPAALPSRKKQSPAEFPSRHSTSRALPRLGETLDEESVSRSGSNADAVNVQRTAPPPMGSPLEVSVGRENESLRRFSSFPREKLVKDEASGRCAFPATKHASTPRACRAPTAGLPPLKRNRASAPTYPAYRSTSALLSLATRDGKSASSSAPLEYRCLSATDVCLGDEKCCEVLRSLGGVSDLLSLRLDNTNITDVSVQELGQVLRANRSITAISLCDNAVTDVGALELIAALKINRSVRFIDLDRTGVSFSKKQLIGHFLASNVPTAPQLPIAARQHPRVGTAI